eukprot:scaffold4331_cov400-Prasinococcus_capsulatus_cf.AAC.8
MEGGMPPPNGHINGSASAPLKMNAVASLLTSNLAKVQHYSQPLFVGEGRSPCHVVDAAAGGNDRCRPGVPSWTPAWDLEH